MTLRKHADGVWGWSRFQPERGYDFSGTALVEGGEVLLVDPVPATPEELVELRALGERFHVVLLTCDHERDAATFARGFGAVVHAPRADLPGLKLQGAVPYDDGHLFGGHWTVHTLQALKTPGESVLHHPGRRLVVAGDAVIGDPVTGLRLVPAAKLADRAQALESLRALARLDFDGLLLADGFVLPQGGREALRRFLAKEGFAL